MEGLARVEIKAILTGSVCPDTAKHTHKLINVFIWIQIRPGSERYKLICKNPFKQTCLMVLLRMSLQPRGTAERFQTDLSIFTHGIVNRQPSPEIAKTSGWGYFNPKNVLFIFEVFTQSLEKLLEALGVAAILRTRQPPTRAMHLLNNLFGKGGDGWKDGGPPFPLSRIKIV